MAKDNDGLLISAGLDISQTLVNIQKDIQKLNVQLASDKNARARIVGGLNLAETTRLINANLATISKGLKLDIGNIDLANANAGLNSSLRNIQDKISKSIKIAPQVDTSNIDSLVKIFRSAFDIKSLNSNAKSELDALMTNFNTSALSGMPEKINEASQALIAFARNYTATFNNDAAIQQLENYKAMFPDVSSTIDKTLKPELEYLYGKGKQLKSVLDEAFGAGKWKWGDFGADQAFFGSQSGKKHPVDAISEYINKVRELKAEIKNGITGFTGRAHEPKFNDVYIDNFIKHLISLINTSNSAAESVKNLSTVTQSTSQNAPGFDAIAHQIQSAEVEAEKLNTELARLTGLYRGDSASIKVTDASALTKLYEQYQEIEAKIWNVENAEEQQVATAVAGAKAEIDVYQKLIATMGGIPIDRLAQGVKETTQARQTNVQITDKEAAATERLLNKQAALTKQFEIQQSKYSKIGKEIDATQVEKFNANINNLNSESLEKAAHAVQQIRLDFSLLNAKTVADIPQNAIENMQKNLKLMSPSLDELSLKMSKLATPSSDLRNRIADVKNKLAEANNIDVKKDNGLERQISLYNSIKVEVQAITKELNAQIKTEKNVTDEIKKGLNTLRSVTGNSTFTRNSNNADVQASITKLNELQTKYLQFQQVLASAKSPEEIQKLSAELTQIKPQFDSVVASAKNLQASLKDTNATDALAQKIRVLKSQIEQYMAVNTKAMKSNKTLGSGNTVAVELNNMLANLKACSSPEEYQRIASNFRIVRNEVKRLGIEGKTLWGTFTAGLKKFGNWFGVSTIFMRVAREIRGLFTDVAELDTALVDLRKTFKGTNSELKQFYFDANDVAKRLGVTTKEVIDSAAEWSRLGYNTAQSAEQMAKMASIMKSVSPGMDMDTATKGLVSIVKAFDIDTDDVLDDVISKINILGNNFAESNADIVEGLQRSSAAMNAMGATLDETLSLFTAGQEIVQDASLMGNALRSISLRVRGYDEETEQLSEDLADITGKVIDLTKVASNNYKGVSLFTDTTQTEYKSIYNYLVEIADIYDEIGAKERQDLLEKLFGKNRAQAGAAILQNIQAAKDAMSSVSNGAADGKHTAIMYRNVHISKHLKPVKPKALLLQCG